MNIIFDTDVIIDVLRGNEKTANQIENSLETADVLGCSTISVGEIFAGMRKNEEKATKELLNSLKKFDVNEKIAERAGLLKRDTKSHNLFLDDCLIAATGIEYNAVLFTKNAKHYPFKSLKVQKVD